MRKAHLLDGYLTVFLTGILALIISFSLALIEGVRANGIRLETEIAFDTALDAAFFEYHKELFRQYSIFAIDASYKSEEAGLWKIEKRISDYLQRNLSYEGSPLGFRNRDFLAMTLSELEISGGVCLSDQEGKVFQKAAANALLSDYGAGIVEDVTDWVSVIEEQGLEESQIEEKRNQVHATIDSFNQSKLQQKKNSTPIESPVKETESRLAAGILNLVVDHPEKLSRKGMKQTGLFEDRYAKGEINQGNLEGSLEITTTENLAFREYLYRYFTRYGSEKSGAVLDYEVEYLIHGADSDLSNLNGVMLRIYGIREGANYAYLCSDSVKCNEVLALATVLATVMGAPELSGAFQASILLAWASVESVYDVKRLMNGKRVPLLKSSQSWHTDVDGIISGLFQSNEDTYSDGLLYQDYLHIFLATKDRKELSLRAMNLIEANIRMTGGNEAFRMDGCYTELQVGAYVESKFGYVNSIVRIKQYE